MQKDWLKELENIMAALRAPDGCPWDREQTHLSLKPFILEEACEVQDAISNNDMANLKEELGDVLMNIFLHAQIGKENNEFNIQDVAQDISEKMIRRHPHVFANDDELTPEEVEKQWAEIKKEEKGEHKESVLDGVSRHLPSLIRAHKIQKKASKVGFDWPSSKGAISKIHEELAELEEAIENNDPEHIEEELGDLLFSIVNVSRHIKSPAEDALTKAIAKFETRFRIVENLAAERSINMKEEQLEVLDELWDEAKLRLKK